ncbi:MurR/RpiR family transcriptional regulator [Vagococcus penaei]|uniref:MurR/RpiR family transcriptional regulator n=1 Tax=Vagococcus penaei TaxID=633807 RepID=UPI0013724CAD|nr:MurR/RpiR family transcriptional regulator [Vagococcus penaei]
MSQQSVIYLLKEKLSQLSKTEKKLATWILENPKKVTTMTVTQLSEVSDASPATIVRLCYSLGLAGFTDLKFRLSREEKIIDQALHTDIVKNENVSTIKKKLKFTLNNAFEETISLLSDQDILKAVSMIEDAEIIYTFGIGASGLAASDLFQKFTRVGKSIMYSLDNHLLSTAIASTEKKN